MKNDLEAPFGQFKMPEWSLQVNFCGACIFYFVSSKCNKKLYIKCFKVGKIFMDEKGVEAHFGPKKVPEWSLQVIFQGRSISSFCLSKCNKILYTKCLKVGKFFMDEKGVEAPFGQ